MELLLREGFPVSVLRNFRESWGFTVMELAGSLAIPKSTLMRMLERRNRMASATLIGFIVWPRFWPSRSKLSVIVRRPGIGLDKAIKFWVIKRRFEHLRPRSVRVAWSRS